MKTTNGKGKICIKRKKKVKVAMEVEKLKRNVLYVAIEEEDLAEMKPADED